MKTPFLLFGRAAVVVFFLCLMALRPEAQAQAPSNQAPTISLGAAITVVYPNPAHLEATVSDDGLPGPVLTVSWFGSYAIGFEHGTSTSTSNRAYFSGPGTYTISATVSDGSFSTTNSVVVTVLPISSSTDSRFTVTTDAGYRSAAGETTTFTPADGEFTVTNTPSVYLDFTLAMGNSVWRVQMATPAGAPLHPQVAGEVVAGPRRYGRPSLFLQSPDEYSYDGQEARFEIKKITHGLNSRVISLWATFELNQVGHSEKLRGEIRYNADSQEPSANQPPMVSVLADRRYPIDSPIFLGGFADDDGLPGTSSLTTQWIASSGPGVATFADANSPQTTVSFSKPGQYTLTLSASDGVSTTRFTINPTLYDPKDATTLTITSEPGSMIGSGNAQTVVMDQTQGDFRVTSSGSTISFEYRSLEFQGPYHLFTFTGPFRSPLRVGRYEGAVRQSEGVLYLAPSYSMLSTGLYGSVGAVSFEIKKISYGANGEMNSLWMTVELRTSAAAIAACRMEFKYRVDSDAPSVNRSPGVFLPPLPRGRTGEPLALHALAADDDLPSPAHLTTTWSMVSGPAAVTFADASQLDTTATFSAGGNYTLALTADDGTLRISRQTSVTVYAADEQYFLHLHSEPGDSLGKGIDRILHRANSTVTTTGKVTFPFAEAGVTFGDIDGTGSYWKVLVRFYASGSPSSLTNFFAPEAGVGVNNYGGYRVTVTDGTDIGTSDSGGSFVIRELKLTSTREISSLWLTFTQLRPGDTGPLTGEVRYNAHIDSVSLNLPPFVDAGSDQTVDMLVQPTLSGRSVDDTALGDQLQLAWSKVSGPGEVHFTHPNSRATTAELSAPGTYVLRLSANDGTQVASDDVQITKVAEETSLRIRKDVNGVVTETFYTLADGSAAAWAAPSDRYLRIRFLTNQYNPPSWDSSFAMPLDRDRVPGPARIHSGALTRTHGAVSFWEYEFFSYDFLPNDASTFEIKSLEVDGNFKVTQCRVIFTLRSGDTIVTGDFRYHWKFRSAPEISFPSENLYTYGLDGTVKAEIQTDGPPGDSLSVQWSAPDGDNIQFDSPGSATTEVHFPGPGLFRIRVTASDGQQLAANEMFAHVTPAGEAWSGLVTIPGHDGRAYLTLTDTATGNFTGMLRLGTQRIPFSGTFDASGVARVTFSDGERNQQITFAPGNSGLLYATLRADGQLVSIPLVFHHKAAPDMIPSDRVGNYALSIFRYENETAPPFGYGWGRITLRSSGKVSAVVALPDGTRASGSVPVDVLGTFALLLTPSGTRDWFSLEGAFATIDSSWDGRAHWMRRARSGKPALDVELAPLATKTITLSSRRNPLTGESSSVPAGLLIRINGIPDVIVPLRVGRGGRTTVGSGYAANCTFGSTGTFSGVVVHPKTRQLIRYSGILMPSLNAGVGFALYGKKSGQAVIGWE